MGASRVGDSGPGGTTPTFGGPSFSDEESFEEDGKEDLCSSIRDPWHFMSISKNDSSGNWSSFDVATLNLCNISGCLALLRPGNICTGLC